jgi:hypothetical protein
VSVVHEPCRLIDAEGRWVGDLRVHWRGRYWSIGLCTRAEAASLTDYQRHVPLPIPTTLSFEALWAYRDCFYLDHDRLRPDEVKAVIDSREDRRWATVERAIGWAVRRERGPEKPDPIPPEVRMTVFIRDGGRCVQCGQAASLEYDHLIPRSLGGAATEANIRLLCTPCNRQRGARLRD